MKFLPLFILSLTGLLHAAPRLHLTESRIVSGAAIEVHLDREAATAEKIGQEAQDEWLRIKPKWKGKTVWIEANVLKFIPAEAPKLGQTYEFHLLKGRTHIDGSEVEAGKLGQAMTPAPAIEYSTMRSRYEPGWSRRTAGYYLRFNDAVDLTKVAPYFSYESKAGKRVTAIAQRAKRKAFNNRHYCRPTFVDAYERWIEAELNGVEVKEDESDELVNGLVVHPAEPLPVGEEWYLVADKGLPIGDGKLTSPMRYRVGDVKAFQYVNAVARTIADQPRFLAVYFNANLPDSLPEGSIEVVPSVPGMEIKVQGNQVYIHGDFSQRDQWNVAVRDDMSSYDGLRIKEAKRVDVTFKHLPPSLALVSRDESQLASGTRIYPVSTINLKSVKVRIKKLRDSQLIRAQQGYRFYTGSVPERGYYQDRHPVPYAMMFGTTVAEFEVSLDHAIDTSKDFFIDWDKVIAGDPKPYVIGKAGGDVMAESSKAPGAFFVEMVGDAKAESRPRKPRIVQSLVQLTDIGMGWKTTPDEAQVFAFSCETGQPLEGVKVHLYGEDAELLEQAETDAQGLAKLPRNDKTRHMRASLGNDQFACTYDSSMPQVNLWRFPINYSWQEQSKLDHRMLVFTERSLYRPSEMVHLKGILRTQNGNAIEGGASGKVRLQVSNPTGVTIVDEELQISRNGSINHSFRLPGATVGRHHVSLRWLDKKESFYSSIQVAEFRRNAFEVTHDMKRPDPGARQVNLDVSAKYFHGQKLAKGDVDVWSRVTERNFYPEKFRDFLFGDHRSSDYGYWYHYFGYAFGSDRSSPVSNSTDLALDEDGHVDVSVDLAKLEFPRTRHVTIQTEVTDANRQTLTRSSSTTVHPSSIYVGVRRLDRLVRVGDQIPLEIKAVDISGESLEREISVTAKLYREVNEQVRMKTDEGRSAVRNDKVDEDVGTSTIVLGGKQAREYQFQPKRTGRYILELRGVDSQGREFATASSYYVYGAKEYPWAYEDNMRIQLVAEKKIYKPGDTARILVLSPIEGKALITVERETVSRSFVIDLDPTNPVISIPLNDDDAPNCFVSVLVIKGAQDSQRQFKEPQLRLGYCELTVENMRDRLAVTFDEIKGGRAADPVAGELGEFLPGSEVTISGSVLLADGKPAEGAEVAVYAVDEGTLAVSGYDTPDPMAYFYNPRQLYVRSGTSLGNFIPESLEGHTFFNKGFFIGGGDGFGGGGMDQALTTRSDFNPCAFWVPAAMAGKDGKFTVTAKLPDTLTRYRLIAVAHHGAVRFGHAEDDFKVNKPLMLEPQVPRFANQGDSLEMRALVLNASDQDGVWDVTLSPNPLASEPLAVLADGVASSRSLSLAAGQSATVSFRVNFNSTGEAVMNWRAEPVSMSGNVPSQEMRVRHADLVKSTFPVRYPMPLMRQSQLVSLNDQAESYDLLKGLDRALLDGQGQLDVEISKSLLLEAGGAVDYLLKYPYGCVEQTTSSMLPWLAVDELRAVSPKLAKHTPEEVRDAVQHGVNRLLSMQHSDGGFGYWPGSGNATSIWSSSYATMGLIMAQEKAHVPSGAITKATSFLIRNLRSIDDKSSAWEIETAARNLWVLSLAGQPQSAYLNQLHDRMGELNTRARYFLAMAEHIAGNKDQALAILNDKTKFKTKTGYWMPWQPDAALELLAWSSIAPESERSMQALGRLLKERNPYGHWRTTWVNSWSLMAMASYAKTEKSSGDSKVVITEAFGEPRVIDFSDGKLVESFTMSLQDGLKLAATTEGQAYIRLSLASKPPIGQAKPIITDSMQIARFYKRVNPDGSVEPLGAAKIGDLIRVDLRVDLAKDDCRYLVIEDLLPANFEAVNNSFKSQAANMAAGSTGENNWHVSHSEIRGDRVMFFYDRTYKSGVGTLSYLARCTMEGEAYAPPAKLESMYDPEHTALSASRRFKVGPAE